VKSPTELRVKLQRQWQNADLREARLLGDFSCSNYSWPMQLSIGKPSVLAIKDSSAQLRQHIKNWRQQKTGLVEWRSKKYQSVSTVVDIPALWCIRSNEEWVAACEDKMIDKEFNFLRDTLKQIATPFHSLIIRQRNLWHKKSSQQIVQCCQLAMQLQAGCAQGKPLRALSFVNIDSKFIEINRALLIKLLNIRFSNALKTKTLEEFLGAAQDNDHWLLVMPLANNILPFKQIRIRASELAITKLPATHILVVENEQSRYQLPELENTIAILGAGLNLNWLKNPFFKHCHIAYWGDIDSWGLKMLAMAKKHQPKLTPVLMDAKTFSENQQLAVNEPQSAGEETPQGLNSIEIQLYLKLRKLNEGRLEQEFLAKDVVHEVLILWYRNTGLYKSSKSE